MTSPTTMIGLDLPDTARWSDRVTVALGQNPNVFTGPGTNTYLVGTGPRRILLDTGSGKSQYLPVLERAIEESGCEEIQEIVLTHGHPDHFGGVRDILERLGPLRVSKMSWPEVDAAYDVELNPIGHGDVIRTEGATLRAIYTPGHAVDHLCFALEEETSLFSGDNVLGVGTTVIPAGTGSLSDYMQSLQRMLEEEPTSIYPAHGPLIGDGVTKIREYIAHRKNRDREILAAVKSGATAVPEIVKIVYAAYPKSLHAAAGQSVCSHLMKLETEDRVTRSGDGDPLRAEWCLA